jgi:uncharacterized protein (DUF1499 family)
MGLLLSCAGKRPDDLGVAEGRLRSCPASPNCVSSDAPSDDPHFVEPLVLAVRAEAAWPAVREAAAALAGARVADEQARYLHVECESRLLGFVDDLELHLRPADSRVAVRSASRLGYSDLGVNRTRVETLRTTLQHRGIVR